MVRPVVVDLHGVMEGDLDREAEDRAQHLDHVVVGVLVVIEQHDVDTAA